ncbi:MAG: response regulator transcription factor [Anaerolineae bacterium]
MQPNKRVLVVDDEAFIRVLLSQTLEELEDQGVELLEAADGREALEVALEEHPHLVFLDVMMPELSGYEVCRQIKATHPEVYVILLTAKGQAVDKEEGAAAGADEYVTKPFDPDYILERAAAILEVDLLY